MIAIDDLVAAPLGRRLAEPVDELEVAGRVGVGLCLGHPDQDPDLKPRLPLSVTLKEERYDESGDEAGIRLAVRDNGPGVPEAELVRVSDLFYTTKEVGKGTGLGLALVHNAVRLHGGEVRLSSEEGRSFHVELFLPRGAPGPPGREGAGGAGPA